MTTCRIPKVLYFVGLFVLNYAEEVYVLKDHDLTLTCPETPVDTWQNAENHDIIINCELGSRKVNKKLRFSSKLVVTDDCQIQVKNFTGNEFQEVQCHTTEKSHKFIVNIRDVIVPEANNYGILVGVEGKPVSITCSLTGPYSNETIFLIKGSDMIEHKKASFLCKEFITSRHDHLIYFHCFVNNTIDGNTFRKRIQLLIEMTPNITIHTSPYSLVNEGDNIELICKDESGGLPNNTEFQWIHNNRFLLEKESKLKLLNTDRNDAGMYQCIASNKAGCDDDTVNITVKFAPVVQNQTVNFYSISRNRTLNCIINDGVPKENKFGKWKHFSTSNQLIRHLNGFENGTLLLPSGDTFESRHIYEDSGIYECRASNNIIGRNGDYWQTGRIKVTIKAKPVLAKPFRTEFYGNVNEKSVMTIVALSSTEVAHAKWLNRHINRSLTVPCTSQTVTTEFYKIPVNVPGYECIFTIQNTTETDFSVYSVSIRNQAGRSNFEISLTSAKNFQEEEKTKEDKITPTPGYVLIGCALTVIVLLLTIWHIKNAKRNHNVERSELRAEEPSSQFGHAVDNDFYQSFINAEHPGENFIQRDTQDFQSNNGNFVIDNSRLHDITHALNYIEVVFASKPSNRPFYIHGADNKTPYADIDFCAKVEPLDSDSDDSVEDDKPDDDKRKSDDEI